MATPEDGAAPKAAFNFDAFPADTLFYERREGQDRRDEAAKAAAAQPVAPLAPGERRAKKERRRRIDPTTFEKQYTDDELEFMNAMQRFKIQTGRSFPSHGEVLKVALSLGYRKEFSDSDDPEFDEQPIDSAGIPVACSDL